MKRTLKIAGGIVSAAVLLLFSPMGYFFARRGVEQFTRWNARRD